MLGNGAFAHVQPSGFALADSAAANALINSLAEVFLAVVHTGRARGIGVEVVIVADHSLNIGAQVAEFCAKNLALLGRCTAVGLELGFTSLNIAVAAVQDLRFGRCDAAGLQSLLDACANVLLILVNVGCEIALSQRWCA